MLNIGIVGTGQISSEFIKGSRFDSRVNIYCVYSRNQKTAENFSKEHNIENYYLNYEELLLDNSVNIVYIASPNKFHFEQARLAIENKKHVLIEKPIALEKEEVHELFSLAKQKEVVIMEALVPLTYQTYQKTKEWTREIGDIKYVDFHLKQQTRHFKDYMAGKKINVFENKMGGGALRDLGPYPLYPLIDFLGIPTRVNYFSPKNESLVDETTTVICEYSNFCANISVSKLIKDSRPSIVSGTKGYILIDSVSQFHNIKLFNVTGELIEEKIENVNHRMTPELKHFVDLILNNKKKSEIYTEQLSSEVTKIISGNYK